MRRFLSIVFCVLGVLFLMAALVRSAHLIVVLTQPHDSRLDNRLGGYLVGVFLPSVLCFMLRLLDHLETERVGQGEGRLLEVAEIGDPVPAPVRHQPLRLGPNAGPLRGTDQRRLQAMWK